MSKRQDLSPAQVLWSTLLGAKFLRDLVYASLLYVVFRVLTTFIFSEIYQRPWSLEFYNDWLPIIAFRTDVETYSLINSGSTLLTAVMLALITLYKIFMYRRLTKSTDNSVDLSAEHGIRNRTIAWASASIITAPQIVVAWMVNNLTEIEVEPWTYVYVPLVAAVSAGVTYWLLLRRAATFLNSVG